MKIKIYDELATKILEAVLMSADFPGSMSGLIGVKHQSDITIWQYSKGVQSLDLASDMNNYLGNIEQKALKNSDRFFPGTPHLLSGVQTGEMIAAGYCSAGDPWSETMTVLYLVCHPLYEKYQKEGEEAWADMALLHVGEWVRKNPSNDTILRVAKSLLKRELVD